VWLSIDDLDVKMPPLKEFVELVEPDEHTSRWIRKAKAKFSLAGIRRESVSEIIEEFLVEKLPQRAGVSQHVIEEYMVNNPFIDHEKQVLGEKERAMAEEVIAYMRENFRERFGSGDSIFESEVSKYKKLRRAVRSIKIPPLDENVVGLTSKEERLLEIVKKEIGEGRRVLLYGQFVHANKLFERLSKVFERAGISYDALPTSLAAEKVEEYCVSSKADVLMVPQSRVATGLDLVQFHTVIFYELNRSVRVVEQAKSRPHRPIGQTKEVRVYYLAYKGTYQEKVVSNTAMKMRAAAAVEGRVAERETIARLFDYDPRMTEALEEMAGVIASLKDEAKGISNVELSPIAKFYQGLLEAETVRLEEKPDPEKVPEAACPQLEIVSDIKKASAKKAPAKKAKADPKVEKTEVRIAKDKGGQLYLAF
jgi:SNF2 family DNA or RNA helicase